MTACVTKTQPLAARRRFQDWSGIRYTLMWAYQGQVLPEAKAGTWTQPDLSCWLLRRGHVRVTAKGKTVTARAGQWIFVASPTRTQKFSDDAEMLSLHLNFSWPGGEPVIEQQQSVVIDASAQPRLEKAALPIIRLVQRHFPNATAFLPTEICTLSLYLQVQNLLPEWLSAYLDAQAWLGVYPRRLGEMDDRVLRAIVELDRRPLSQKFTERALVERVGLGRSQLNALFYQATGVSPRRYHERRREEAAERLLTNTRMSVKEIAIDLGFGTESHFSHWFRRRKGCPPLAYRGRSR